jgi:hypothetical protein
MAGTTMTLGAWKQRVGDAIELRKAPGILGIAPAEVGDLVKRKSLPVHTFRIPDGTTFRMVRRSDLDMVKASLRKPQLCDLIAALNVMTSQP